MNMVDRAEVGKPLQAWSDPLSRVEARVDPCNSFIANMLVSDGEQRSSTISRCESTFYDQETLEEKLRGKKAEIAKLLGQETDLQQRLASARSTLTAMRSKKRDLSTAATLSEKGAIKAVGKRSKNRRNLSLFGQRCPEDGSKGDYSNEYEESSINVRRPVMFFCRFCGRCCSYYLTKGPLYHLL